MNYGSGTERHALSRQMLCRRAVGRRHFRYLENMTSYPKPINRCVLTWTAILPNGIPIWFETMEPSLPRLSGSDCRYTFVPSSRLTVLKSRWSLSFSPLTAPNWYVSRHCICFLCDRSSVIALMRALVMTYLLCYGTLEIVCLLNLLLLDFFWRGRPQQEQEQQQ